jgi:hypothetical protein
MNVKFFLPLVLTLVLVLGACAPQSEVAPATPETNPPMQAPPTPTPAPEQFQHQLNLISLKPP